MKSFTVLLVNKAYLPTVGGVEKVVQILAEGLRDKGIKTIVLACRSNYGPTYVSRINRVPILYAGSFGTFYSLPISISFFWYLFKFGLRFDVVHWHEPFPLSTIGMFAVNKKKRIVTYHSDIVRQKFFKNFFSKLQIFLFNRSQNVISTSPPLINFSEVLKAVKRPVMSIPIGIKLIERFPKREDLLKWKFKNIGLKPYCLFVGRLVYYKGIKKLVEAMEATNAHLVIIGQGPLEGTIRELINDMNSNSKITLITSSVSDEELKAWFYNCDFLVLPSIARSEAFGIVQIEAMAVGKPVINTNLGTGVPFVSINNKTGLTVEVSNVEQLTNAINKLWGNKKLIREYGKSARIRAKNEFDCNVMLSRYIKAYIKVFNSKN